ncbi:signal recognition particle subunit FFH/SRP54 (srp54) [Desulfobotulus alkaliphilus]|uniref:Signal recognition particle protein n=1 Tax=Desulfobotulus alkaliphilus TaxID=622671 RepID=A0A562RW91_9BACT|nr:signal recognition particle protein [Desulfobotulus alkaliphilus]TWI73278.1 signal recognition particle subunit FFH/SRP54 (srp54) [Desulfobotulus alkaliphilus]
MFDSLNERLGSVFKALKGRGKLTEAHIEDGMKEVRMALLEADVHYRVVKQFVADVKARSLGREVMESLTPGQQVVKIVYEELTRLMGEASVPLELSGPKPAVVMLVGLQGAGKTTTAGKLALYLRKTGKKPYLVPADVYRPAAIEQLQKLAGEIGVPVYPSESSADPLDICLDAREDARKQGCDVLLVDTAGRLHVDETLMAELVRIREKMTPSDILLVADAMTGQDAVKMASAFDQDLGIGGIVLTKTDGDARGGAALSIRSVTGRPVKFVGTGEKISALDLFHPDRMASRILGMGDTLSLIEKAQEMVDEKQAADLERKLRKNEFTLEDFRDQLRQVRKMGPIGDLLKMLPGVNEKALGKMNIDERELVRVEAIINSMTPEERRRHAIINGSRRKRIARGSGTRVQDVNQLLKNYTQTMKMVKKLNKGGLKGMRGMRGMLPF